MPGWSIVTVDSPGGGARTKVEVAGVVTTTSGAVGSAALAERVHQFLMDEIVEGRLAPGATLREASIGELLGVSRTPVREALRELAELGLVRIEVNRSYRVAELDLAYLAQAGELYAEVFGLAARLAGPRLTSRYIEFLALTARDAYRRGLAQEPVSPGEAELIGDLFLRRCGNVAVEETLTRLRPHAWRLHHAASREFPGLHLA